MPSIRYKGPHIAVELPSLGNRVCANGEAIDVTDQQAEGLINQADWELVPAVAATPSKDGSN